MNVGEEDLKKKIIFTQFKNRNQIEKISTIEEKKAQIENNVFKN